ncbi:MAG: hypothetical protein K2N46_04580 [Lachnospiraceae bacterium]|nr:hypothetical protein [Lachnospiraceae bacterium]
MKKAEIIYRLMNDMLRYLLKYSALKNFTESDIEQALADSDRICEAYKNAPCGIGYLAYKMCVAINSYFMQKEKKHEA